ncbi:TonB-dependent receptor plug domain-containing protein, partial [Campylobacter sp.]|uniref:TonB-dependent receptor plug domain-containing protein n=1 Tax=Campylobacter sp. TaxID=205 RepID=UPI00270CB08D|nr:TonB-dependent receptor plug domain-containing protein [Campylobacter sp.]
MSKTYLYEDRCMKFRLACSIVAIFSVVNISAAEMDKKYQIAQLNVDANLTGEKSGFVTKTDKFQSVKTISRDMIESMPSGNGDFVQLLRTNPNVQFSNTNRQSTTMGEIDPANISINGSKYWQNNFMIDGVNINNDLDPARNPGGNPGRYSVFDTSLNSVSQGMAIDSDFIESIDVYDSDVSAKYGSFTGGVVSAKTRDPRAGFHGKFSVQHTQDEWTKFHLYGNSEEEFLNSSDLQNQPKFDKWKTRLNLEGFLTDDLGIMFGYTNTRSKIPLQAYDSRFEGEKDLARRVQRRNIDNYFLKALWYATDRLTLTPSVTYAPSSSKVFNDHVKNSYSQMKSGGLNLALKADYDLDFMQINQILAYNKLETSRDAEHEYFKEWRFSNVKNWGWKLLGSLEGGYGDIDQTQNTISYNADLKFDEVEFGGITHKFLAGLELKKQEAKFDVKNEFMTAGSAQPLSAGVVACDPNDELCSIDDSYDRFGRKG